MSNSAPIARRVRERVQQYSGELELDAWMKIILGVLFSLGVFVFVYCLGWFAGLFVAESLYLAAWQFGLLLALLFLAVATWSAWHRVDPLAGLPPLTDQQLLMTLICQATPGVLYFSPRHATAGAALLLLGGPVNVFEGMGILKTRLEADEALLDAAARLLPACDAPLPVEEVEKPAAAILLRRLNLLKFIPNEDSSALTLTEKGYAALGEGRKRSASQKKRR